MTRLERWAALSLQFNFTPRTRADHFRNALYMSGFGFGLGVGLPLYAVRQTWRILREARS